MESAVSNRMTPRRTAKTPASNNRIAPKKSVGRSPPKMAFGRRMSTANDYKAHAKPEYGTNHFDKRMELQETLDSDKTGSHTTNNSRSRRHAATSGTAGSANAMQVDVLRQLKAMRGTKRPPPPFSTHQSRSKSSTAPKTRTAQNKVSPTKSINNVPHNKNAQVRKWISKPFT